MKQFLTPRRLLTVIAGLLPLLAVCNASADLVHRYSFNDAPGSTNAIDSVGGATGNLYPGASYPGDGTVLLDGSSGFVYLPNDIISNLTSVGFEVWTTPISNPTWARLFDFGNNQGGPGTGGAGGTGGNGTLWTYVCFADGGGTFRGDILSPTLGEDIVFAPQPAPGISHDVVFTIDAVAKTASLFDNGALVSFLTNFNVTPQSVGHTFNDYIGRSQWPDPYYNGSIDEFRIYSSALVPAQAEADFEAGPNATNANPGSLTSIQFNITSNILLNAIVSPSLLGTYSGLTNEVNITTLAGIVYSSDDTNIVNLGTDGKFHAVAVGSTTLHATLQTMNATLNVTVNGEPVVLAHRYSFDGTSDSITITDSVGGLDGTLVNQSATAELNGSGQLVLDGNASSGYVSLPPGILTTLTNATFQVWLNWTGGNPWQQIYSLGSNFNGNGVTYTTLIPRNGANNDLRWSINEGGEVTVDAPSTLVIGSNVVVTVAYNYTAQTASMYLNSRKVGQGPMSKALYTINDGDNYIGRSQFSADPYFQGTLDEFRIYSGVKSDLQVAIDAATGPANTVTNPGALTSITLIGNTNVDVHGFPATIQVAANFANVSNVDIATLPQTTLISSDPTIAKVVNGNVVPESAGTVTITGSYAGVSNALTVSVIDTNGPPSLLHRWSFNDAPGSPTFKDSVGTIDGTLQGLAALDGSQLVMPAGNPVGGSDGLPTASSGWASFPANSGIVTSLPNEASFDIWVVWQGGGVWQEMFDFGQAATPGVSLGGGQYVMICPYDGASGSLRAEWDENPTYDLVLSGPPLTAGVLSQVVWTHDQDRQIDKLYRNGVQVAIAQNTGLWSTLPDSDNWMARDEWPDPMFNGSYSDFRIWSGALTDAQVAQLYQEGPDLGASRPTLGITFSAGQIVISWPASATGFSLQSTSDLSSGSWSPVAGTPTVVNGQNTLTITTGSTPTFYRLSN